MPSWLPLIALLLFSCVQLAHAERTTTFFHTDATGSVVAASDQSGALLWRKEYAPFGQQLDSTAEGEKLSYTGKEHDDETGLTYFGARYYDPQLGRFTGIDPAGVDPNKPNSFNRYAYANNNPYRFIDPDGREVCALPECDEIDQLHKSIDARGAGNIRDGGSGLSDVVDEEASSPWNWIPFGWAAKIERAAAGRLWTSTKSKTAAENAFRHFKDHGVDFGAENAVDYVKRAQKFLRSPPSGTLTRVRANGDIVRYNPGTNTFGVMDASGAPRTFFKPDPAVHGYRTNLDYFNAQ